MKMVRKHQSLFKDAEPSALALSQPVLLRHSAAASLLLSITLQVAMKEKKALLHEKQDGSISHANQRKGNMLSKSS